MPRPFQNSTSTTRPALSLLCPPPWQPASIDSFVRSALHQAMHRHCFGLGTGGMRGDPSGASLGSSDCTRDRRKKTYSVCIHEGVTLPRPQRAVEAKPRLARGCTKTNQRAGGLGRKTRSRNLDEKVACLIRQWRWDPQTNGTRLRKQKSRIRRERH